MANKVYTAFETPITFQDSGGSAVITLNNLATAAGRISARYDRGAGSIATWYLCRVTVQLATTGTLGEQVEVYISTSDGTHPDGEIGTADAALTTDKRRNLKFVGFVYADQTATNTDMTGSFLVQIPTRYFSVGIWNATTDNLRATANSSLISFTPVVDEIQ